MYNDNPSMQNSQDPMQLTPEDAKASLGISNMLIKQMMTQQAQEQGQMPQEQPMNPQQTQESAPQQEEPQEPDKEAVEPEKDLTREFDEFKGEIKGMIETELGGIREMIKDALSDGEDENKDN